MIPTCPFPQVYKSAKRANIDSFYEKKKDTNVQHMYVV